MLKKRPRYTLDNKLESKIDEYYRDVLRPRSLLIESEEIALQQLKASAGIQQGLRQTPMVDGRNDAAYKMYSAQLEGSKIGAAGYMGITGALPVSAEERVQMYGEDMGAMKESMPPYVADLSYKVFPRQFDGPRLPQTLPPGDPMQEGVYDYAAEERRMRERLAPLRDQINLDWVNQNQEVYNAALERQQEEIKAAGEEGAFNGWQALPGVDVNRNGLLRYGPDDEIDLEMEKIPQGITQKTWRKLKAYARQNNLGTKVKRTLLDPFITKLPKFLDWVRDNKVATAATVAALGAAAGYQFGYIPEGFAGMGQEALIAAGNMARQGIAAGADAVGAGAQMLGAGLGAVGQGIGAAAQAVGGMFIPQSMKGALNQDMPAFMDAYNKGDAAAAVQLLSKNGVSKSAQGEWMAKMLEQRGVETVKGLKFDPDTGNFIEDILRNYVSVSAADTIFGKDKTLALKFLNNADTQGYVGDTLLRDLYREATGQDPNAGDGLLNQGKKYMADLADRHAYADGLNRAQGNWGPKMTNILNPGAAYGPGSSDPNAQWAYQEQAPGRFRKALGHLGGIVSGVYGMLTGGDSFESGAEVLGNTLGLATTAFGGVGSGVMNSSMRGRAILIASGYLGLFTRTGRSIMKSSILGLAGYIGSKINAPPAYVAQHLATHRENMRSDTKYNGLQVANQAAYDAIGMQNAIKKATTGLISEALEDMKYTVGQTLNFAAKAWKPQAFQDLRDYRSNLDKLKASFIQLESSNVQDKDGNSIRLKTLSEKPKDQILLALASPNNNQSQKRKIEQLLAYRESPEKIFEQVYRGENASIITAASAADDATRQFEESKVEVAGNSYKEEAERSITLIPQGTKGARSRYTEQFGDLEEDDDGDWTKLLIQPFSYAQTSMKKAVVPILEEEEEKDGMDAVIPEQRDFVDTMSKKGLQLLEELPKPKRKREQKRKTINTTAFLDEQYRKEQEDRPANVMV